MQDVDEYAVSLLEQAKRFLEKAESQDDPGKTSYLHASLLLAFCSLEAHVNAIASDFVQRTDLDLLTMSILCEKETDLKNGKFGLTNKLKIYRLEERIEFLHRKFSGHEIDKSSSWWSQLKEGLQLRNDITHPRDKAVVGKDVVKNSILSIIEVIDVLYFAVYRKNYPSRNRGLQSNLDF